MKTLTSPLHIRHKPVISSEQAVLNELAVGKEAAAVARLVLQPRGDLDQASILAFHGHLVQALYQATEAVIVDLLWVGAIDAEGLAHLETAVRLAARLGKQLSFQSAGAIVRTALDQVFTQEAEQIRAVQLGDWQETWQEEFDAFLSHHSRWQSINSSSTKKI
jgi:anti-anti-sigma regulatory factor